MASQSAIKLTKLVERFELEVLNQGKNYDRCLIRADDINRPALQILGFFDYFAPDRIQVSHSHRRSNRTWKPNVKRVKAVVNGTPKHVYVCTHCLRSGKVTRAV